MVQNIEPTLAEIMALLRIKGEAKRADIVKYLVDDLFDRPLAKAWVDIVQNAFSKGILEDLIKAVFAQNVARQSVFANNFWDNNEYFKELIQKESVSSLSRFIELVNQEIDNKVHD